MAPAYPVATLSRYPDRPLPTEPAVLAIARRAGGRERTAAMVLLTEHPDQLRVTPGKWVDEHRPNIDWNNGRESADDCGLASVDEVERFPTRVVR